MARPWGFPIAGVQTPVRLWHGELDTTVPVGMGRYLANTLPNADATFYPTEAHHLVYDRWREILADFAGAGRHCRRYLTGGSVAAGRRRAM